MPFFSRNAGVRRLAIVLSALGAIAASVWEYKTSPIIPEWRAYRRAETRPAQAPPATQTARPSSSAEGWDLTKFKAGATGEEPPQVGDPRLPGAGDYLGALMILLLGAAVPFALVHATAWVVHGFNSQR
jgi:hypothetical protein